MSGSVLIWLVIAVLLFWGMGAYNRLVRLRSRGIAAFASLESVFNQYLPMVKAHVADDRVDGGASDASQAYDASWAEWAGLVAAAEQFNASLKVAHGQPLNGPTTSALRTAHETLCLSWLRLQNLPLDLAGPALPITLQSEWEPVSMQAELARSEFNRRVLNYNQAIDQFPARLLAWAFGFKPAQPI